MKLNFKRIFLLLITFLFLYLIFVNIDFIKFLNTFKTFNYKYSILLMLSIFISMTFRALCFKEIISKTVKKTSLTELIFLCITGSGLNILMPLRAGDLFRAYFTGEKYGADKIKIFGSLILERILDCIIIFSLLFFGILKFHKNTVAINLCISMAVLILTALIFLTVLYKSNNIEKICSFVNSKIKFLPFSKIINNCINFINKIFVSLVSGFEIVETPEKLIKCLIFSFGIWIFECFNYLIILYGYHYSVHWSVTIFIICFIALACMIPSASIFIGPYQLAVISAFKIYNIPKESALAMSVTEQSIVLIFTFIVSALFLIKNNISISEIKKTL